MNRFYSVKSDVENGFFFSPVARLSFSGSITLILRRFTCARTVLAGGRGLMVGWMGEWIGREGYVARGRGDKA